MTTVGAVEIELKANSQGVTTGLSDAGKAVKGFEGDVTTSGKTITKSATDAATSQEDSAKRIKLAHEKVTSSIKDVALGAASFAGGVVGLAYTFDSMEKSSLRVEKANKGVDVSTRTLEDAQTKYTAAVAKFGATSPQALSASNDLDIAQQGLNIAVEKAKQAEDDNNQVMLTTAVTIVPEMIMAVGGAISVYKDVKIAIDAYKASKLLTTAAEAAGTVAEIAQAGATGTLATAEVVGAGASYTFAGGLGAIVIAAAPILIAVLAIAAAIWLVIQAYNALVNAKHDESLVQGSAQKYAPAEAVSVQSTSVKSTPAVTVQSAATTAKTYSLGAHAQGAHIEATSGGVPAIVAEGGQDEWIFNETQLKAVVGGKVKPLGLSPNTGGSQNVFTGNIIIYANNPEEVGKGLVTYLNRRGIRTG